MTGANLIDAFIIVFIALWAVHGYRIGFVASSIDFTSFIASLYVATYAYSPLSTWLNTAFDVSRSFANLLAFVALFALFHSVLSALLNRYARPAAVRLVRNFHLSKADRIAGVLPTVIGGIVWLTIILGIISWFPISSYLKEGVDGSLIGGRLVRAATVIEPRVEQIAGGAVDDTIGFITTQQEPSEWCPNIPPDSDVRFDPASKVFMLSLVNRERKMRGLRILVPDTRLRDVARSHSLDMVENNYFDHRSPTTGYLNDRLRARGVLYLAAGENLAYAQDVELAHNSLMESEGHRENLLTPYYGKAGIGIIKITSYGYMCTQVFTD